MWSYVVLGKAEGLMDHYSVLNLLLANACPREASEGDVRHFEFDLHCATAKVTAELISTVGTIQYNIISVEVI